MGIAFKNALINTIRPPKLIYLFLHEPSLPQIDSNIGSQVDILRDLAPTGNPR
jgi:hypothetical protein